MPAKAKSSGPTPTTTSTTAPARLRKQLAAPNPDPTTQAAGFWLALDEILGDKGLAPLFDAWGKLAPDQAKPEAQLKSALLALGDKDRLEAWWTQAAPVLFVSNPKSTFATQTKTAAQLKTPPKELAKDDGTSAGKTSMAGGGHAVRFEADGEQYLTAVRIFGSRYGQPAAPRENAFLWLCDAEFKPIASFAVPYGSFERGEAKWVTVPVTPTRVPQKFIVCVGFNPTATKGVFVHYDGAGSGDSFQALPNRPGRAFSKGDWLIRAVVQQPAD